MKSVGNLQSSKVIVFFFLNLSIAFSPVIYLKKPTCFTILGQFSPDIKHRIQRIETHHKERRGVGANN